jgi:putative serine/threonine protein kinase
MMLLSPIKDKHSRISTLYIGLDELDERKELILHLSFPMRSIEYASRILDDLRSIGVESIAFVEVGGRLEPLMLGKGYRGLVLRGRLRGREAALKILRTDSTISSLRREAEATSMANRIGVGPAVLGFADMVLALKLVEGTSLGKWLNELGENRPGDLRRVLRACFEDARKLDKIGLDHGELSDVKKHVIVKPGLKPVIIDFGKASLMRRPSNVTSLLNYFLFGPYSQKIRGMLGIEEPLIEDARNYKMQLSDKCFQRLMESLNMLEE